MWTEDVDDSEFVGGGIITPQQAYIKEYDRSDMRERIVIEFHSPEDMQSFMQVLADLEYNPQAEAKVCGAGMCGQTRIYGK